MNIDIEPYSGTEEEIMAKFDLDISALQKEYADHPGANSDQCAYLGCGRVQFKQLGWREVGYVPELQVFIRFMRAQPISINWSWDQGNKC